MRHPIYKVSLSLTLFLLWLFISPTPTHARETTYIGNYEVTVEDNGVKKEVVRVAGVMGKVVKSRTITGTTKSVWDYAYYTTDAQGSTRQEITENKPIPKPNTYYAYGAPVPSTGSGQALNAQTQKVEDTYTGQKKDEETGLMYYNARYYNPATGLFLQADSVDDTPNKYQYVASNPVNNIDPSGNECRVYDYKDPDCKGIINAEPIGRSDLEIYDTISSTGQSPAREELPYPQTEIETFSDEYIEYVSSIPGTLETISDKLDLSLEFLISTDLSGHPSILVNNFFLTAAQEERIKAINNLVNPMIGGNESQGSKADHQKNQPQELLGSINYNSIDKNFDGRYSASFYIDDRGLYREAILEIILSEYEKASNNALYESFSSKFERQDAIFDLLKWASSSNQTTENP